MRALWTQEEASYDGEFVKFGPSWAWPKPVQPHIPVLVGAAGNEKNFKWIARSADGWITTPRDFDIDEPVELLQTPGLPPAAARAPQIGPWTSNRLPEVGAMEAELELPRCCSGCPTAPKMRSPPTWSAWPNSPLSPERLRRACSGAVVEERTRTLRPSGSPSISSAINSSSSVVARNRLSR